MKTDNTTVVAAALKAYSDRSWNEFPGLFAPEVECQIGPNAKTVGFFDIMQTIEYYARYFHVRVEPDLFIQDGKTVAFRAQLQGEYHTTEPGMPDACGQKIAVPMAGFADVENGLITKMQLIFNYEDWLRASA